MWNGLVFRRICTDQSVNKGSKDWVLRVHVAWDGWALDTFVFRLGEKKNHSRLNPWKKNSELKWRGDFSPSSIVFFRYLQRQIPFFCGRFKHRLASLLFSCPSLLRISVESNWGFLRFRVSKSFDFGICFEFVYVQLGIILFVVWVSIRFGFQNTNCFQWRFCHRFVFLVLFSFHV